MADPDRTATIAVIYAEELRHGGQVIARYHDQQQRDLLRHAGRRAGRLLHRPVRTFDTGSAVHVVITDWGQSNPLETRLSEVRANKAIDRALDDLP